MIWPEMKMLTSSRLGMRYLGVNLDANFGREIFVPMLEMLVPMLVQTLGSILDLSGDVGVDHVRGSWVSVVMRNYSTRGGCCHLVRWLTSNQSVFCLVYMYELLRIPYYSTSSLRGALDSETWQYALSTHFSGDTDYSNPLHILQMRGNLCFEIGVICMGLSAIH